MAMGSTSSSSLLAKRLVGKVAVITGGASGIGEATARLFALHGAKVVVADIQEGRGRSVCSDIGSSSATFALCDVTVESDVRAAVDLAVSLHGGLDVMFNNAGVLQSPKPLAEADAEEFDSVLRVIARGAFLGTKHAARVMVPARRGSIVTTASVSSALGGVAPAGYTCAKHAVVGLARGAAAELGRFGVRVNCVSPHAVATPMLTRTGIKAEVLEEAFREHGNLKGVVLKAVDVAQAVLYLASDEARYVSGHNLLVDGGYTIANPSVKNIDMAELFRQSNAS